MSNDKEKFDSIDDELAAMSLSEEDTIMQGIEDLDNEGTEEPGDKASEVKKDEKIEDTQPKLPTYSKKELLSIFDTLLFEGEYRELIPLGKSYTVKFRNRTAGESNDVTRRVDSLDLKTYMAIQNYTQVLTLTYAICEVNGVGVMDEDFGKRYKRIRALPEPLIVLLSEKLFEFDRKVMLAMREGQENF